MDVTRTRLFALLLLAASAGGFGYSLGWQRGQISGRADGDRQLQATTELQHMNAMHPPDGADTLPDSARDNQQAL